MSEQGVLYIVATPIGNLDDMTPRARAVLSRVDAIAAEDTRHSGRLLTHFGINTRSLSLHEHNEREVTPKLVASLQAGESVALISDAGTPLVSDPGYHLVQQVRELGIRVVPIPGASALIAALSAAGLPSDRFAFEGFLSSKGAARRKQLEALRDEQRTLLFYEAPHRIQATLADMAGIFGEQREAVVARELTKTYETIHGDSLGALCQWVAADENQQRGEIVILVHGAQAADTSRLDAAAEHVLGVLLEELPLTQAVALAVRITGHKRNALYQRAVEMAGDSNAP